MISQKSFEPSIQNTVTFRTSLEDDWATSPFPTLHSSQGLLERLRFILRREAKEQWLPIYLRRKLKKSFEKLTKLDREDQLTPALAQKEIETLASIAYEFDELTLYSSTLCQIRALDMEMNEERYRSLLKSQVEANLSA